jgi:hypothetical protein
VTVPTSPLCPATLVMLSIITMSSPPCPCPALARHCLRCIWPFVHALTPIRPCVVLPDLLHRHDTPTLLLGTPDLSCAFALPFIFFLFVLTHFAGMMLAIAEFLTLCSINLLSNTVDNSACVSAHELQPQACYLDKLCWQSCSPPCPEAPLQSTWSHPCHAISWQWWWRCPADAVPWPPSYSQSCTPARLILQPEPAPSAHDTPPQPLLVCLHLCWPRFFLDL